MVVGQVVAACGVTWCLALVGCGSDELQPRQLSPTAATTTGATEIQGGRPPDNIDALPREWIAVFRVAPAEDLEGETQELLRLVPENVAIAPIPCWVGLGERLSHPRGERLYVSAAVAESRRELERVVDKVGRAPILEGMFPTMCID